VGTDSSTHPQPAARLYIVRRGDTLWLVAERQVPGQGRPAVVRTWKTIWSINQDVIGPDPNLILPGQRLRLPAG